MQLNPQRIVSRGTLEQMAEEIVAIRKTRQATIFVDWEGERLTLLQLARRYGFAYYVVYNRYRRGKRGKELVTKIDQYFSHVRKSVRLTPHQQWVKQKVLEMRKCK
jgi:hypothetical protein